FQGACEMFHIPVGGSGVFASSLGMDKVKTKMFCCLHDIPVVEGISFSESKWQSNQDDLIYKIEELHYPVIVKPVTLGSSIGIMKAEDRQKLIEGIETAFRYDEHLIVERAIQPLIEINCAVLGTPENNRVSVCEQPISKEATLSFADKYQNDDGGGKGMASAERIIPAERSPEKTSYIQQLAQKFFAAVDASGVARLDFLMNEDTGEVYFNEINTIPGSFSYYLWEKQGMSIR